MAPQEHIYFYYYWMTVNGERCSDGLARWCSCSICRALLFKRIRIILNFLDLFLGYWDQSYPSIPILINTYWRFDPDQNQYWITWSPISESPFSFSFKQPILKIWSSTVTKIWSNYFWTTGTQCQQDRANQPNLDLLLRNPPVQCCLCATAIWWCGLVLLQVVCWLTETP